MKLGTYTFDRPALYLAPMDDVTDAPFRDICHRMGADVTVSEFIASDALIREIEVIRRKLISGPDEHPFGIQIFGNNAESLCAAARLAEECQPDFIDINWGCPAKKIAGKNAGSGMLQYPDQLVEITRQVVRSVSLPVTVKTRIGYNDASKIIVELAKRLQEAGIRAIAIHGRTKSQMYKGEADWSLINAVKNDPEIEIPVIGNGDITSAETAMQRLSDCPLDGIMIGRGAIGNPWIFARCRALLEGKPLPPEPDLAERARICEAHLRSAAALKGERTGMLEMRKHYKPYFKGLLNIKEQKIKMLTSDNIQEVLDILQEMQQTSPEKQQPICR